MPNKKTYRPDKLVHPVEIIGEMSICKEFGNDMYSEICNRVTPHHAMLLGAVLKVDRQFFINLQKNYDEDVKRLGWCAYCQNDHIYKWDRKKEHGCRCECHGEAVKKELK
jgi:hypothetical protein